MRLKKLYPYILILVIAMMMILPQINAHAFIYGVDSAFHMNRFYDTAMQIQNHQYSYFQSFYGFQKAGRVVNALYGPIFAYLNGGLLLLAGTWYRYQIWTDLIVLFISGSLMYRLAIKNHVKHPISIIIAVLYMMSDPVMAWVVGQQFTGWGAAFFPLALLMGTEMVQKRRIQVVKLALTMALLMQIHVMTSVMAALALVPFFIAGMVLSKYRSKMVLHLVASIGLTLLLTANVWSGMLELSLSNNLLPVAPGIDVSVTAPRVAGESQSVVSSIVSTSAASGLNTLGISLPFLLMILATVLLMIFNHARVRKITVVIFLNGLLFLWIASDYFPWHALAQLVPTVDYIQFASRFLVVAITLLLLAFGMCLSIQRKVFVINGIRIAFVAYLLLSFNQTSYQVLQSGIQAYRSNQVVLPDRNLTVTPLRNNQQMKPNQMRKLFFDSDLSKAVNAFNKPTPDYLPFFVRIKPDQYWIYHPYHLYKEQIQSTLQPPTKQLTKKQQQAQLFKSYYANGQLHITWFNSFKHDWWVSVPVIKYAHTQVARNGRELRTDTSTIGKLIIESKPGINHATISYQPDRWFNQLVMVSILTWVVVMISTVGSKILVGYKKLREN